MKLYPVIPFNVDPGLINSYLLIGCSPPKVITLPRDVLKVIAKLDSIQSISFRDQPRTLVVKKTRTYEDVMLSDLSLVDYIAVSKTAHLFLPHTQGRYQMRRFRKALCPIVERLACSMMMHGRNNGKKLMAVRIVKHAFEIIHLLTDKNPIQVFVDAVKNGGPREDSTRVGSAGVVRRQAVDVSPLRRVNQAIYLICTGARNSAFRNIKSISECLADEIMNCAKESSNSYAIKKKDEIERVAKANR